MIAVKEPYFGQCPTGDLAVCVHHPSDCVFVDTSSSTSKPDAAIPPTCSANFIVVCPSELGGCGIFATAPIALGSPILLEKAFALTNSADSAAYENGVDGILKGERTNVSIEGVEGVESGEYEQIERTTHL